MFLPWNSKSQSIILDAFTKYSFEYFQITLSVLIMMVSWLLPMIGIVIRVHED